MEQRSERVLRNNLVAYYERSGYIRNHEVAFHAVLGQRPARPVPNMMPAVPRRPAPVFAALGDATRLRLLEQLGRGRALSISALTRESGLTRQAVSKHLRVLSDVGLVRDRSVGREHLYEIHAAPLREAVAWCEQYRRFWEDSFDQLELYLQTMPAKE
jgi:DNA-binding transcriptional ArsR family regulator